MDEHTFCFCCFQLAAEYVSCELLDNIPLCPNCKEEFLIILENNRYVKIEDVIDIANSREKTRFN